MSVFEIYPQGVNTAALDAGVRLHEAALGIRRIQVDDSLKPNSNPQRKVILDLAVQLIIAKRNEELDHFARSWLKWRGQDGV